MMLHQLGHLIRRTPQKLSDWIDLRRDCAAFHTRERFLAQATRFQDPQKRVLIVSLTDWPVQIKTEAVLATALRLRGWTPYVVTASRYGWARKYFAVCGIDHLLDFDRTVRGQDGRVESLPQIAEQVLAQHRDVASLLGFRYRDAFIGRHVLSSVVRNLRVGRIDLRDPHIVESLRRGLRQSLQALAAAEAIFDAVRPGLVVFLERGYSPYGEFFDVAVNRRLNTIQWFHGHRADALGLKRYHEGNRHVHGFSLSPETWEAIRQRPWTQAHERVLLRELQGRYEEGSWFSRKFLHEGKRLKPAEESRRQLGLDPTKKTAVIFSHVLWDATFFFGENLFEDYEEWLIDTVRAACANTAVNWVIKLHPDYVWKLKMMGGGEIRDRAALDTQIGRLPSHVKLLLPETDLNTFSLFPLTDYCLTVRGTIGIEMACFGIPVLTAGTGRYSGLGFTIDSTTREDYLKKLRHIQHVPSLSPEQTTLAQRYAYTLLTRRLLPIQTFEMVQRPLQHLGHSLDQNVIIQASSLRELQDAPDLNAFADWAADARAEDFLMPDTNGQDRSRCEVLINDQQRP